MSESYDLIVIGAGMAGVSAANKCASQGWKVAIVDALPYGGTCALRGCDPKKILRRGAEIIDSARLMRGKGINDGGLSINWADLMKHKHGFTDPVPGNTEDSLTGNGIDTLHGVARFTGKTSIEIGGIPYEARHFLLATGARPRPLDVPRWADKRPQSVAREPAETACVPTRTTRGPVPLSDRFSPSSKKK